MSSTPSRVTPPTTVQDGLDELHASGASPTIIHVSFHIALGRDIDIARSAQCDEGGKVKVLVQSGKLRFNVKPTRVDYSIRGPRGRSACR